MNIEEKNTTHLMSLKSMNLRTSKSINFLIYFGYNYPTHFFISILIFYLFEIERTLRNPKLSVKLYFEDGEIYNFLFLLLFDSILILWCGECENGSISGSVRHYNFRNSATMF